MSIYAKLNSLAPVEIMAGKIRIETNGDVKIEGNVAIAGDLEVEGTVKVKELTTGKKETGKFVVGFSDALDIDVNFNWWVIEVQNTGSN